MRNINYGHYLRILHQKEVLLQDCLVMLKLILYGRAFGFYRDVFEIVLFT